MNSSISDSFRHTLSALCFCCGTPSHSLFPFCHSLRLAYSTSVFSNMRSIISLLAFTALAHAAPRPQQIEYEIIGSSPLPKRDGCTPQPTTPNTYNVDLSSANAFRNDGSICNVSMAAQTPSGYLQTFMELYAATSTYAYMGYMNVDTYSPSQCSAQCDSIDGCTSFNICAYIHLT